MSTYLLTVLRNLRNNSNCSLVIIFQCVQLTQEVNKTMLIATTHLQMGAKSR
uniref:Uncharacterized protein n=1 Tax=Rhizophora mucronata TaxID=61149 RepID=A0A2P2QWU3_RHIMU